ncbi:MAG: pyridoxal phosphate-dependent aminotransferase family protein [Archangium sp.]
MADVFDRLLDLKLADSKNRQLLQLLETGKLYDNVATEIRGRKIQVHGKWLDDFASCNYLGFDLREDIMATVLPEMRKWGTHPSWARLACSPELYSTVEQKLAALLGVEDTIIIPTISLLAIGLIPALTGKGSGIFADRFAHKVNFDGCRLARDQGAKLFSFTHTDPAELDRLLTENAALSPKLVVIDGVLSVTGRTPNIPAIVEVARKHDAIVYIDDAHGFGVIGENPTPERPYGLRGNGVVKHFGLSYDNILYVSGMSKAYSSLIAFVACPKKLTKYLKTNITAYIYSGPVPTAALATALAGLEVNEREGEALRDTMYGFSKRIAEGYRRQGIATDNDNAFPIVSAYVGSADNVARGGQLLFDDGINVTMQAYPIVPKDKGVLRATPTAANTVEEVDHLISAMGRVFAALK